MFEFLIVNEYQFENAMNIWVKISHLALVKWLTIMFKRGMRDFQKVIIIFFNVWIVKLLLLVFF